MPTVAEYLEAAASALKGQIANMQGGRMGAPAAQMFGVEKGLLQVFQAAHQAVPTNGLIERLHDFMEGFHKAPYNVVRNAAQSNPGSPQLGAVSNYLTDLNTMLNLVQQAQQQVGTPASPSGSGPATPTNRAHWTMHDWQREDSEGLQAQMKARTPLFMQLYKQAYGKDFAEQPGKRN